MDDEAIFMCFLCLSGEIYCESWKFESDRQYSGNYDHVNKRFKNFQLRSTEREMRSHLMREHNNVISTLHCESWLNIGYVDLTNQIDRLVWSTDFQNKRRRQKRYVTKKNINIEIPTVQLMINQQVEYTDIVKNSPLWTGREIDFGDEHNIVPLNLLTIEKKPLAVTIKNKKTHFPKSHVVATARTECRGRQSDSDSDDGVVTWGKCAWTPVNERLSENVFDSGKGFNNFVTDSGRIVTTKQSYLDNSQVWEPKYFHDIEMGKETVPILLHSPRLPPMNEHYNKLDYDYIPTPIDNNDPLVEYCPPIYTRDFWDETITPERPPIVVPKKQQTSIGVEFRAPLFTTRPLYTKIQKITLKAVNDLIQINEHLTKYKHFGQDYHALLETLEADSIIIAKDMVCCSNRMFKANLLSSKYLNICLSVFF
jgi:hypothetical protein